MGHIGYDWSPSAERSRSAPQSRLDRAILAARVIEHLAAGDATTSDVASRFGISAPHAGSLLHALCEDGRVTLRDARWRCVREAVPVIEPAGSFW